MDEMEFVTKAISEKSVLLSILTSIILKRFIILCKSGPSKLSRRVFKSQRFYKKNYISMGEKLKKRSHNNPCNLISHLLNIFKSLLTYH